MISFPPLQVLGRHGYRLRPPADGPPDRLHDHRDLDAVRAGFDRPAARLEGPGVGGPRLPGPAMHRVAGHRLPDLRDGVQLLRAAAGDSLSLLADIPGRSETNPPETAGKSPFPPCCFMSTKHRAAASWKIYHRPQILLLVVSSLVYCKRNFVLS